MPNKHSKAGHVPSRTCFICKHKAEQKSLLSLFIMNREIVFDINRIVPVRKKYVCHSVECLTALNKWLDRQNRKSNALRKKGIA